MAEHALRHEEPRLSPAARASRKGLRVLGWGEFWLLSGILGGLLAMFAVIFLASLASR